MAKKIIIREKSFVDIDWDGDQARLIDSDGEEVEVIYLDDLIEGWIEKNNERSEESGGTYLVDRR